MATRSSVEILKAIVVRGGGLVSRTVEESGVVRIKILMKRQELEQVVEQVSKERRSYSNKENNRINANNQRQLSRSLASKSLKPPVDDDMKKMKIVKADKMNEDDYRRHWRPVLQSIPEEF